MFSRNGCYVKSPRVTIRTFEEWGRAYAYTPDDPELYDLNASAWLIVELCDGRPFSGIEAEYVETLAEKLDAETARRHFHAGFATLLERGIIEIADEPEPARSTPRKAKGRRPGGDAARA